jgi:hypothetical protein
MVGKKNEGLGMLSMLYDVNGAKNILQRFLDGQFTVARGTQRA